MIKQFIRITFLHFRKHILISLLNIAGLAIGIACFVLIMLYVNHELNYDKFNEHYKDIYRVAVDASIGNTPIRCTWTPAPMAAAMSEEFPEIRAITRIVDRPQTVKIGDLLYNEDRAAAVDSSFIKIFTLTCVEGSPDGMLTEPGQVLLDRSTARKYFGDEPALGKLILIRDTVPLTVTGVYEDFPARSHFHFNMLISLLSFEGLYNNPQWFANDFKTYLKLAPGFPRERLEAKLPMFVNKYLYQGNYQERTDDENYWNLYLQQIREIHLGSDLDGEFEPNGNLSYIRIFTLVAILLLLVACINYMNLTTARSSTRAREIGIRKTNGASRKGLRRQFFAEAIIISILAMMLAMILVEAVMGPFRSITGREIELHYLDNFLVIPALLALSVIVGMMSGIYPAIYMSRLTAIDSLGFRGVRQSGSWFRNILVLFQFSVAISLIAATAVVRRQMDLIMEDSLGFNKEHVVLVKNISYMKNLDAYKDELRARSGVIQVSAAAWVPGDKITNWSFGVEGREKGVSLYANITDESYVETMGMEMVNGRYFSRKFKADNSKIVLNETAVKLLELSDPIGTIVYLWGSRSLPYEVVGVVKDYHWESKHMTVRPHALLLQARRFRNPQYLSIRVGGSDYQKIIRTLRKDWEKYVPALPFEYELLDKHYDGMYRIEKQTRSLLNFFSLIVIVISCLGLFGLAAFMTEGRTKEIGIRKTNGATTGHILRLLTLDFTRWVILANVVAWPLTWYAMMRWLENFAYRVDFSLWICVLAGITALLISIATVSYHAIRASMQNPGTCLRYE